MDYKKILIIILFLFCIFGTAKLGTIIKNNTDFAKIKYNIDLKNDQKSDMPNKFSVILSPEERKLLIHNLQQSKHYLEFGAGGSTFLALLYSDVDVVSVENEQDWINDLRKWKYINKNENITKRLKFYYTNTGETTGWGIPANPEKDKNLLPNYSANVFKAFDNNYDIVLIDGRYRVACTLQTILNTDANVKIFIHDYTYRPEYHVLEEFLDLKQTVDSMVYFKKKKNIDKKAVAKMYEKFKYDFR